MLAVVLSILAVGAIGIAALLTAVFFVAPEPGEDPE